jgi:hypothetical protein
MHTRTLRNALISVLVVMFSITAMSCGETQALFPPPTTESDTEREEGNNYGD